MRMCLQRLLQLSAADVYRFADSKQDADTLLESIRLLRETGVSILKIITFSVACIACDTVTAFAFAVPAAHARSIGLMQMVAPKLMAEDSANNFSQNSGSEENSPPASASSTPTAAEAQVLKGPFHRMDVCETPHSVEEPPEPQQLTQPARQPTQPAPQPTQPVLQPTQPDLQPTQPVVQPSLPVPHPPRVGSLYRMPTEPCSCI